MTISGRFKKWILPVILAGIFFTSIALMVSAPTDYRFLEDGKQIHVTVYKDQKHAKVRIVSAQFGNTTEKYSITAPTSGETDIVGSFSNGKYAVAKNGNLRLDCGVEIHPQKGMRYSVAAAVLLTTIALIVCVAVSSKM